MQHQRERNNNADLLKFIAIFGVVWIHSFSLNNVVINTQIIADMLRFCVPSFVILWAYFYELGLETRNYNEYRNYIGNRLFRLAVPYFFWSLLHIFTFYDVSKISWFTIMNGHLGGSGWAGQFFLVILFQLTVILPFIRRYISWKSTIMALLMSLLYYWWVAYELWQVELVHKFGHRVFLYWIPYVFIGIVMAKKGVPHIHKWIVFLFIMSVVTIPIEYQEFRAKELRFSPYVMPSVLIASILFSIAVMSLQNTNKVPVFIRLIGKIHLQYFY